MWSWVLLALLLGLFGPKVVLAQAATEEVRMCLCSIPLFLRVVMHRISKRENSAWRSVKFKLGAQALTWLIMLWLSMMRLETPSLLVEGTVPLIIQWLIAGCGESRTYCPRRRRVFSTMCWKSLAHLERKLQSLLNQRAFMAPKTNHSPRNQQFRRRRASSPDRKLPLPRKLSLLAFATIASRQNLCLAANTGATFPASAPFDSDSVPLMIDNCCSACITTSREDFVGPTTKISRRVSGVAGSMMVTEKGTVRWSIEDDEGRKHTFDIPNSYLAPSAPSRLLSPQHWAQSAKDNQKGEKGTWSATYDDCVVLHWHGNTYHRSIRLDPATNVAVLRTASGSDNFEAHVAQLQATHKPFPCCFAANVVTTDEESVVDYSTPDDDFDWEESAPQNETEGEDGVSKLTNSQVTTADHSDHVRGPPIFRDVPPPASINEEQDEQQQLTPTAALLRAHYKLAHLPFDQIRLMAANGHLPKKLINCRVPRCTSCLFGKATKTPWRSKASKDLSRIKVATEPGQCVSVDQLESPTPGLLAQLKGTPTLRRYRAATVFVDHFSRMSFVHLQQTLSSEDTLLAKQAFERFCSTHGVKVIHYHADNGRFADNAFLNDVRQQNQSVTYCGVNAHFQNGVAEKRIRDLQDHTRTAILHATARWPAAISTYLWPYALRTANDVLVSAPRQKDGKSAMELFCKTAVTLKVEKFRPFGCPVYILNSDLQAGKKIDKWYSRARVGIYLGKVPETCSNRGVGPKCPDWAGVSHNSTLNLTICLKRYRSSQAETSHGRLCATSTRSPRSRTVEYLRES